jgi:hypothetical protein
MHVTQEFFRPEESPVESHSQPSSIEIDIGSCCNGEGKVLKRHNLKVTRISGEIPVVFLFKECQDCSKEGIALYMTLVSHGVWPTEMKSSGIMLFNSRAGIPHGSPRSTESAQGKRY